MASCIQTLQSRLGGVYRLVNIATSSQICASRCAASQLHHYSRQAVPVWCSAGYGIRSLHTSDSHSRRWERFNKIIHPPQKPDEPRRPAEVYYARRQIKYSHRKMWYVVDFIKGMMIDDALSQLELMKKKGAHIAREVLLEAQKEAMEKHNVEFKSNLHIADARTGKGQYDHAIRFHGRGHKYKLDLPYCNLYVCLREGPPPEKPVFTGYDQAERYMDRLRHRYIHGSV